MTDKATVEVVEMILSGLVNKRIVQAINDQGGRAVGISGKDDDLMVCVADDPELGFVGRPVEMNVQVLRDLYEAGIIPVVAPVATGMEDNETFNVNGDTAAGAIAGALQADRLLLLTDVAGVKNADGLVMTLITPDEVRQNPRVVAAYLGSTDYQAQPRDAAWDGSRDAILFVKDLVIDYGASAVVDKVKDDRLRGTMIEAAEQCERTALPQIATLTRIEALLQKWPAERTLYFCDERGGEPFLDAITAGPGAVLIGPEGGFTDSENAAIRAHPNARPVSLGPRILRADTAAVTAISVWMAKNGDWSA